MARPECRRLLGTRRVGRLGFLVGDQPMVLPVNFGGENGVVVFRTGDGAKLEGARKGRVAFEVDDLDADGCDGWSVVIQGVAEDFTGTDDWFPRANPVHRRSGVRPRRRRPLRAHNAEPDLRTPRAGEAEVEQCPAHGAPFMGPRRPWAPAPGSGTWAYPG